MHTVFSVFSVSREFQSYDLELRTAALQCLTMVGEGSDIGVSDWQGVLHRVDLREFTHLGFPGSLTPQQVGMIVRLAANKNAPK